MPDLTSIAAALSDAAPTADLPVEKWAPTHCGEMDLVIRRDGAWIHEGGQINRPQLVRLLSRVLRKDEDGFVLVTPAEKLAITVEDVPFLVTDYDLTEAGFTCRTNVGDRVEIGPDHPIELRDLDDSRVPYIRVRHNLWARFDRAPYYRLLNQASIGDDGRLRIECGSVQLDLGKAA